MPQSLTRRDWSWLLGVLVLLVICQWRGQWRDFGYFADANVYLAGARSLAQGEGYRMASHLGTPRIGFYPPLQSLALSPAWRWGGEFPASIPWFNALQILYSTASLTAAFVLLRRLAVPLSLTVLILVNWGLSAQWLAWMFFLCSDIGFTGVTLLLGLWWLGRDQRPTPTAWLVTGLVVAVSYLWRTAALAWIVGFGSLAVLGLRRGGWQGLVAFLLPTVTAFLGWRWMAADGVGYGPILKNLLMWNGGLKEFPRLMGNNLRQCALGVPFWQMLASGPVMLQRYLAVKGPAGASVALAAVLAIPFWAFVVLVARGWWAGRSRYDLAAGWVIFVYLVEVAVVPYDSEGFHRYFYPLLPFLVWWAWRGAHTLGARGQRLAQVGIYGLFAVALLANLVLGQRAVRQLREFYPVAELKEAADWLRTNTPESARVGVDYYLPVEHLRAWLGRPLLIDPFSPGQYTTPLTRVQQGLVAPDYVVTSVRAYSAYEPPAALTSVFRSSQGGFEVYRVDQSRAGEYLTPEIRYGVPRYGGPRP